MFIKYACNEVPVKKHRKKRKPDINQPEDFGHEKKRQKQNQMNE